MATKIFKKGKYIVLDDGTEELRGNHVDVIFQRKTRSTGLHYSVIGVPGKNPENLIPFSDITDEAGAAYTEAGFETLITT